MDGKSVMELSKEMQKVLQLIIFRVADEEFGLPIGVVQEIIKVGVITPIPDSPDFIRGLINVRGEIVSIIDVSALFCLPAETELPRHIIITKNDDNIFGLMVEEVIEVLRIHESDIKSPPKLMTKIHDKYVKGVIAHEGRLIILLRMEEVLSEKELIRLTDFKKNQNTPEQIDLKKDNEPVIHKKKKFGNKGKDKNSNDITS